MDPHRTRICWAIFTCFLYFTCEISSTKGQDVQNKSEAANQAYFKEMTGKAAVLLKDKFQQISGEELGLTALNEILDSLHPSLRSITDEDLVLTISERLSTKLNAAFQILQEMKYNVMNDSNNIRSFTYPCPLNSFRKTHLKDIDINSEKVTLNIPEDNGHIKRIYKNTAKKFNLKIETQYFMSASDGATDETCGVISSRSTSRRLFHQILQPQDKFVILLVDDGKHVSIDELRKAATVTKELVNILHSRDSVALSFLSEESEMIQLNKKCNDNESSSVSFATENNKELLVKYLSSAEISQEASNISSGFERSLDLVRAQRNVPTTMIVYVGKKSSLIADAKMISEILSHARRDMAIVSDIIITGCNVEMEEESDENGSQMFSDWFINFNSSVTAGQAASLLLLKLPVLEGSETIGAVTPIWEPKQKHLSAPFLIPLYLTLPPLGLLVIDLYLSDIAEDIIYFSSFSKSHRAFIIDFSGNVIVHSSYPRPEFVVSKPRLIDISNLETDKHFDSIKDSVLSISNGVKSINSDNFTVVYTWKWVKQLYIVCVVSESGAAPASSIRLSSGVAGQLQHHRMDLLPPPNTPLCRHFLMVSTIQQRTLYLSPSSFQSPFSYLFDINNGKDISLTLIQSYMAYLKDTTRLLSNPGLKSDVRNDVGILNRMLNYFKGHHIRGAYNKYIVRRYAASDHGVLVLFPGTILESDFEPNRKSWFLRALRSPGKIILTPPYLDIGGAGFIVTISQAPPISAKPSIVLSIDMTMRYLYKILLESLPPCTERHMRCFIMDDRGYLLSHPGLVDPSNLGPIEQTHITHEESLIANDMLNHRGFVRKNLCKNYADNTLQRFYKFNTSLDTILTNLVHGEHCARYYIAAIPGTNAFIGMVNSSCNLGAFCPCSVVDRLCLNCNRMEQNECECPCECLLPEENTCSPEPPSVSLCDFESERNHHNNYYISRYNLAPHLDSCFDFQCESYGSRSSCLGVLGCEWCELDRDGENPLTSPFCTVQTTCFSGVLGAPTPYEVGSFGQVTQDDCSPAYSAVGPIVGCIVALCLILALAVYCYKQNLTSVESIEAYSPPPVESWPRAPAHMNHLNSEDDIHDERSGHQDKLLLANEPAAPISPYRILTGYRRPNTTGESDHGYSTMTPHDDSEHQAFALVEPFLSQENAGGTNSPTLSTPRNSATDLPLTMLPCGKNNILAPVTVHRHMEAT